MKKATRILILCTANSARSQMAEGFLKHLDSTLEVYSAGATPAVRVNPHAIAVMKEVGIDIGRERPKTVEQFLEEPFDFVVTVCADAERFCPRFTGQVKKRLHIGFADPALAAGSGPEILEAFRRVRDEIRARFVGFYESEVRPSRLRACAYPRN
jgi:arsenate reductase